MKLLALDTATEACSVALWLDGRIEQRYEVVGRGHSQRLPQMLQELLADCGIAAGQLDGIACGIGPGSFAGVRIGVGFAKGLALGLDRPVQPVTSLAMLAQGATRQHGAQRALAAIDARMNEVYFAAYVAEDGLACLQGEALVAPAEAVPMPVPGTWAAAGTGWSSHGEALRQHLVGITLEPLDSAALPQAHDALLLAAPLFAAGQGMPAGELLPLYLRNRVALTKVEQEAFRNSKND